MNTHFDKKLQIYVYGKFPSECNAHNITLYCEFSNATVRHAIRMVLGMSKKSFIVTSGSENMRVECPLQTNMERKEPTCNAESVSCSYVIMLCLKSKELNLPQGVQRKIQPMLYRYFQYLRPEICFSVIITYHKYHYQR